MSYYVCSVYFENGTRNYSYLTDDVTISQGDFVVVPVGVNGELKTARVVDVKYYTECDTEFPIEHMKWIVRKCTKEEIEENCRKSIPSKTRGNSLQVKCFIDPYIRHKFLAEYIEQIDIDHIVRSLYSHFVNVGCYEMYKDDNKKYLEIRIEGFIMHKTLEYEIRKNGMSLQKKRKDSLSWIDRIEDYDAMLND